MPPRSGTYPWIRDALLQAPIEGTGGVRYHLHSPLGEGGQGFVYRASYDEPDGFWVVVKLLRPDVGNEDAHTRFQREAEVLRKLGQMEVPSPHIVRYFDHAILPLTNPAAAGDRVLLPFTVLEYIHGPTLAELFSQHAGYGLPVGRVRRLFRQLARALTAIHAAKIVHRDLKPNNVLIAKEHGHEVVKITDFGLVKRFDVELRATIAIAGASVGYAPPEQFEQGNKRVSERTDLFAFSAMLFEALTGASPFSQSIEETSMQVISRMITGGPPCIAHHLHRAAPELATRSDVVATLDALLARALAPNPDDRPSHTMAFWAEVEAALLLVEPPAEQSEVSVAFPGAGALMMFDEPSISIRSTPDADDVDVASITSHQSVYDNETRAVFMNVPLDALPHPSPSQAASPNAARVHRIMAEPIPASAGASSGIMSGPASGTMAMPAARPRHETAPVPAMRAPPVFPESGAPHSLNQRLGSSPPATPHPSSSPSTPSTPPPRVDAFASTHGAGAPSVAGTPSSSSSSPSSHPGKSALGSTHPLSHRPGSAYSTGPTAVRTPPQSYGGFASQPPTPTAARPAFAPRVRVLTASPLPERARAACFSPDGATIFALGYRGAYVLDGPRWTRLEGLGPEDASRARGILVTPAREVVVYGDGGLFGGLAWGGTLREWARRDPDITWVSATLAPNEILLVGNQTSRDLPVVGSLGVGAPLAIRVIERCPRLLGGTRLRSGSLLGVSVAGDPVCVAADGVVPVSWPRTGSLRAAVGTPDGGAYVVGLGGHVLRVDPRLSATLEPVHTTKDLYHVVVSETGVCWAGGVSASLVRRSAAGWLRVHLPDATTGAVLGIAATDNKARVVLDDGVVVEAEVAEAPLR